METILFNIDSAFRNKSTYPKSSFFVNRLDQMLRNIKSIKLSSIELPNSFYNLSSLRNNTSFTIILLEGTPGDTQIITIPDGKYTSSLLITKIQEILDNINISTDGQPTQIKRYNFTISLNNYTQKITISNPTGTRIISGVSTAVGGANFTLTFPINSGFNILGLGSVLGYLVNSYTGTDTYTSEKVINLYIDPYIFVRINDYGNLYNKTMDRRLLAKIIMDGSNNSFIYDNKNFVYKMYEFVQPVDIERLEIELLDRMGNRLDLNDCDYSLTLELEIIENKYIYDYKEKGYLIKP